MRLITAGWRRFRRQPAAVQGATWVALAALYTGALIVLLGGGDDGPRAKPLTALERKVSGYVNGVEVRGTERTDVPSFRQPRVREVSCGDGEACQVTYSVGLPGRGRILVDQRRMWEQLFRRTDVVKGTMTVTRDAAAAGVPPKPGEETPTGAPLLTTRCDRSKRPNVDWSSARGAQILYNICEIQGYDQGEIHRQEPVAPDDETAGDVEKPPQR